ncbi:PIN/TRAM domain-containing protein [Jannaschia sp. R86511]|uniref:PIN/TRAM domain-containing protein n=1 Tax=Jannaschia sp. R86511 TaxID=3093853 RepID=UPI0036D380D1
MPVPVIEALRLCVVVFLAGVGAQVGDLVPGDEVGGVPVAPTTLGVLLGACLGYVLGGGIARGVARGVGRAERVLAGRSAEQILSGLVGAGVGVLAAAFVSWPLLVLGAPLVLLPVFVFVLLAAGTVGYRLGLARREAVLRLIGSGTDVPSAGPTVVVSRLLDTSVAVDGRVVDVVRAGFLHGRLVVPAPVLGELQGLADSGDDVRRARGRRGLATLAALRSEGGVDVEVVGDEAPSVPEVDAKLVRMALDRDAALLTLDTNLAKVASLAGARVMNLHALAVALRPPVGAGDGVTVTVLRPGKEPGQGVGYLDDGTMVVVEDGRRHVGRDVAVVVSSVLTTANGRMVFARPAPGTST